MFCNKKKEGNHLPNRSTNTVKIGYKKVRDGSENGDNSIVSQETFSTINERLERMGIHVAIANYDAARKHIEGTAYKIKSPGKSSNGGRLNIEAENYILPRLLKALYSE